MILGIIIIYLIGCVCSYLMLRAVFKQVNEFTIADRYFVIVVSIMSWLTLIVAITMYTPKNSDKPAKW